jgi:hypothetical protein
MRLTTEQIRQLARNAVIGGGSNSPYTSTQAALITLLVEFGIKVCEAQEINKIRCSKGR